MKTTRLFKRNALILVASFLIVFAFTTITVAQNQTQKKPVTETYWETCKHCKGTGVTLTYSGTCPYDAGYCSTCKETASQEHGHDVCRMCQGGQVKRTRVVYK